MAPAAHVVTEEPAAMARSASSVVARTPDYCAIECCAPAEIMLAPVITSSGKVALIVVPSPSCPYLSIPRYRRHPRRRRHRVLPAGAQVDDVSGEAEHLDRDVQVDLCPVAELPLLVVPPGPYLAVRVLGQEVSVAGEVAALVDPGEGNASLADRGRVRDNTRGRAAAALPVIVAAPGVRTAVDGRPPPLIPAVISTPVAVPPVSALRYGLRVGLSSLVIVGPSPSPPVSLPPQT